MKTSITFSAFCDAFYNMGREDQFSYDAKRALFDFLEEVAPDIDLDVIALCCEYAESDVEELIADYDIDVSEADGDEEEIEAIVEDYLNNNTMVVGKLKNGRSGATTFVYSQF